MSPTFKLINLTLIFLLFISGCAGTVKTDRNSSFDLKQYQAAHIVSDGKSTVIGINIIPIPGSVVVTDGENSREDAIGDTAKHIQKALANHHIISTIGNEQQVPPNATMLVMYEDKWQWDFKMFLKHLTIKLLDSKSRQVIAEGSYTVGGGGQIHDYPTAEREVPNIINGIYQTM
jgi:uncharacterized protein YceK